jgi:hypothetical protein
VQPSNPAEPPDGAFYSPFPHALPSADEMNENALAEQATAVLQGQADLAQSEVDDSLDADLDPFTPRRGHAHKRAEEPPRNDEGKFICRFQNTCGGQTFERKCEWRYDCQYLDVV